MAYPTTLQTSDLFKGIAQDILLDAVLPPIDESLCCCSLLDPQLAPQQHLNDCVLHLLDPVLLQPLTEELNYASSRSSSPREDHKTAQRRKHRESMARLRQCWRTSLATLQREERQLQAELKRTLAGPSNTGEQAVHPLAVLRQSYRTLVQEQLELEQEQENLEAARIHNEKYEKLLERELDRGCGCSVLSKKMRGRST